ncbi:peptidoglycan/LPS O-acetylase OafA/YrhL [Methylosinus sp. sav-2]|uniref:acyltransferase family protein n=1 Tax=Methylosinus sp. sav-2 TaxID=2485168 RepID=UPI00047C1E74|nr:acyltransferase [Methylosinus sp. sav-2]TDX61916.1 peptidoglycan/LPS O-acetylase OafA/YrhL [Methylosinus sp. sav-2]
MSGPSGAAERLEYIDALRGYAVLGVIAVHTSQAVIGFDGPLQALASSGRYGVQLFFVVSGLTLMASWEARRDGALAFYIRRISRVAPMFWLAIVAYLAIYGLRPRYWAPDGVSWADVLATTAFAHGASPWTINSVVPGGWSIAAEMTFYAIFPLLASRVKSLASAGLGLVAAIAIAIAFRASVTDRSVGIFEGAPIYLLEAFSYFALPSQLPAFFVGMLAYRIGRDVAVSKITGAACALGAVGFLLAMAMTADFPGRDMLFAGSFGALAISLASGAFGVVSNRPAAWLGKISYGVYLWHFAAVEAMIKINNAICKIRGAACGDKLMDDNISFALMFCVVVAAAAALASVTYHAIERPMIAKGRRLAQRWRPRAKAGVTAAA